MDISSAKYVISEKIGEIAAELQKLGLIVSTEVYIEDENFEKCLSGMPKRGYVTGNISVYTALIPEDDGLVFECCAEFKGDTVSDKALDEETVGFDASAREFIAEISSAESPEEYLTEYIKKCNAEAEEMMAKFDKQIDRMKIATYVAGAVAVVVVLAITLGGLLF